MVIAWIIGGIFVFLFLVMIVTIFRSMMNSKKNTSIYKKKKQEDYFKKSEQFDALLKKFFDFYLKNNTQISNESDKEFEKNYFPYFSNFKNSKLTSKEISDLKTIQKKYFIDKFFATEKQLLIKCYEIIDRSFTIDYQKMISIYTQFLNNTQKEFNSIFVKNVMVNFLNDNSKKDWYIESEKYNQTLQKELNDAISKINGLYTEEFFKQENYRFYEQAQNANNSNKKRQEFYVDNKLENSYKILNVSSKSTNEEIKSQYKKLAKMYHPDISKDKDADKKMAAINEAYDYILESRGN